MNSVVPASARLSRWVVFPALLVWLLLAIFLGVSGRTAGLRPPLPQIVLALLTVMASSAVLAIPALRDWARRVSVSALVGWHLTRLVAGAYFLVLARRGSLPRSFALPAGIGDVAVALLAALLLLTVSPGGHPGRRWYVGWNVLGLLDITMVVLGAARASLADPASMEPLLRWPLSLLPTFLVPTIFVTHFILFWRLAGTGEATVVDHD